MLQCLMFAWRNLPRRNRTLSLVLGFLWAMHLSVAFTTVWYMEAGLSLFQIFQILAIMSIVTANMEVLFGWLADRFGVKRVLLAGLVLQIVQSTWFALSDNFWSFLAAMMLNAVAWAMTSGTTTAIVANTSTPQDSERYQFWLPIAESGGALCGVAVGGILVSVSDLSAPFLAQPITFVVALVSACFLYDNHSTKPHAEKGAFGRVCRVLFVQRADVRWLILLAAVVSAGAQASLWLTQPNMEEAGYALEVFAWVYVVRTASAFILSWFNKWIAIQLDTIGVQLMLVSVVGGCAVFAGGPSGKAGAFALLIANAVDIAFVRPLVANAINKVPEVVHDRATAQSTFSALKALVFVPVPLVGFFSANNALLCIGTIVLSLGGALCWMSRRSILSDR